ACGCAAGVVALPALAAAAGCVGTARSLRIKRRWCEPAVLWTATVRESGKQKSPGFDVAVQPLFDMQCDELDSYRRAKEEHKKNPDGAEEPARPPAFVTTNCTIEALGRLLRDTPKGLLVARDELDGWFKSFTRYQKGGGSDRPDWLQLYRAGVLLNDRMSQDERLAVRGAAASVTGTIQPNTLAAALDQDAREAGLAARLLLAMPPAQRRVRTEADVSPDALGRWRGFVRELLGQGK